MSLIKEPLHTHNKALADMATTVEMIPALPWTPKRQNLVRIKTGEMQLIVQAPSQTSRVIWHDAVTAVVKPGKLSLARSRRLSDALEANGSDRHVSLVLSRLGYHPALCHVLCLIVPLHPN